MLTVETLSHCFSGTRYSPASQWGRDRREPVWQKAGTELSARSNQAISLLMGSLISSHLLFVVVVVVCLWWFFLLIRSVISCFPGKKSASLSGGGSQESVGCFVVQSRKVLQCELQWEPYLVWEQGVANRWSQCETIQFCESSASEVMLHFLKQKFTFKKMEGILYKIFQNVPPRERKKEMSCTNYC